MMGTSTPPWFRPWIPLEASATELRDWQNDVVPGLLQTEDYARAIMSLEPGLTPEVAAERVTARMGRQSALMRADLAAWFLVSEVALRMAATTGRWAVAIRRDWFEAFVYRLVQLHTRRLIMDNPIPVDVRLDQLTAI